MFYFIIKKSILDVIFPFQAHGPNFKKNKILQPFDNVNIYPLLCKLLNINCHANNGTTKVFDSVYISDFNLLDKISEIWNNLYSNFNKIF